jgi:hypothetical protein
MEETIGKIVEGYTVNLVVRGLEAKLRKIRNAAKSVAMEEVTKK